MSNTATSVNGQVSLLNLRLSFPCLFTPEAVKNGEGKPRYGATILIPKSDTKTKALIDAEIAKLAAALKLPKGFAPQDSCFGDGDMKTWEGYEGHYYLSANRAESQGRPTVVDRNNTPLNATDGRPYAGCFADFVVRFYTPKGWKKACCSLEVVRFRADGEPFGAPRVKVEDALPDLPDDGSDGLDPDDV